MTSYSYDRSYEPPAPVAPLRMAARGGDAAAFLLPAVVDSGAYITVVPTAVVRQLSLGETDRVAVRAAGAAMGSASLYAAQVEVEGVTEIVEVLALGDEALLGRNLLRTVVFSLDGSGEELMITHRGREPSDL